MAYLHNLTVRTRLYFLIVAFAISFLTFGAITYRTIESVKVNGPMYRHIIQGKDLIADILPPP